MTDQAALLDRLEFAGRTESLFDRTAELLSVESTAARRDGCRGLDRCETILGVGSALALQLQLALGLTVSDDDRRDVATAIFTGATTLGVGSASAIGAITSVLDTIARHDDDAAVDTADRALSVLDPFDLLDAAAAVSVTIIGIVADRLALDPATVLSEMVASVSSRGSAHRAGSEPSRCPHAHGVRRQTWSGRNSQCHVSRGTASTQPNLGPFVFSH